MSGSSRGVSGTRRRLVPVGLAGVTLIGTGVIALVIADGDRSGSADAAPADVGLRATDHAAAERLQPGAAGTGSLTIRNTADRPARIGEVVLAPPTSDECGATGVSLAPTLPPTKETPLEVPAGGTATLPWTAYMDGEGDDACQGATLTSVVTLDGEEAGTVVIRAAELDVPPAPTTGQTTSTRAAVRWTASDASDPGWVVERAIAGTTDWEPACGSSAQRPVRALSCTDTGLTASTAYVYRVTLRTGHWTATSLAGRPARTQARPSA